MILVAATAVGIALARPRVESILQNQPTAGRTLDWITGPSSRVAIAWTLALTAIGLRRPRPRLRRLARQPGTAACIAVMVTLQVEGVHALSRMLFQNPWPGEPSFTSWHLYFFHMPTIGLAVMGAWIGLSVTRGWHAERSWIDRMGRVLGAYWIGFLLLDDWVYYLVVRWLPAL